MGSLVDCKVIDYCAFVSAFDDLEGVQLHKGIHNHSHNHIGTSQVEMHIGRQRQGNGSLDELVRNSLY